MAEFKLVDIPQPPPLPIPYHDIIQVLVANPTKSICIPRVNVGGVLKIQERIREAGRAYGCKSIIMTRITKTDVFFWLSREGQRAEDRTLSPEQKQKLSSGMKQWWAKKKTKTVEQMGA